MNKRETKLFIFFRNVLLQIQMSWVKVFKLRNHDFLLFNVKQKENARNSNEIQIARYKIVSEFN